MHKILSSLLIIALLGCDSERPSYAQEKTIQSLPLGKGFDFYVLALSWSPGYCASEGINANKQQCGGDPDYGFTLHGLWPQYKNGYPSNCKTTYALNVDRTLTDTLSDIMPSNNLVHHQWRKHGTCSNLNQGDYFAVSRAAFERITIPKVFRQPIEASMLSPDIIEKQFIAANPEISSKAIAVTCNQDYLRDIRICLSIDLKEFTVCPEVNRRSCSADTIVIPPI